MSEPLNLVVFFISESNFSSTADLSKCNLLDFLLDKVHETGSKTTDDRQEL